MVDPMDLEDRQHQGVQGEDDDELEIGSDYPYANEILGNQINRR
jgi:CO dehydrogenase/acetyl-CoA synthase beta subunit